MVMQTSQISSRTSSVTVPVDRSQTTTTHHALGTTSLRSALKKPFQGWSKELLRARDHDDDDYNFTSGARRGAELYREDK
ncbi:Nn.00g007870.m01.CDS01 [Neocucurbitaria sp. VM-36]